MKKKVLFITTLYFLLVILSFGEENIREKFKVHFLYNEVNRYIEEAQKEGVDLDVLYEKYLISKTPVPDRKYLGFGYLSTPKNLKKLKENCEILKKNNVTEIVYEVLEKANERLSSKQLNIFVVTADPSNIYVRYNMKGVWAFTWYNDFIIIGVNPQSKDWKKMLKHVVAHEYHHHVCYERGIKNDKINLLKVMISEGKADSFANIVSNVNIKIPWIKELDSNQEKDMWNKIKDRLNEEDYYGYIKKVIFGEDGYIKYTGYKIGYDIMQNFIRNNSDVSIEEWTEMNSKDILKKSRYVENIINSEI